MNRQRKKHGLVPVLSILMLLAVMLHAAACARQTGGESNRYEHISQQKAKELMDAETNVVILDVRTDEEYAAGHIEGAILIPDYEIADRAEKELTDKEQLILVYCRSGRRSRDAAQTLADLGYTNVKEFGGINSWPYGTVK